MGNENKSVPVEDLELLEAMDREKLYELLFMQVKNIWRVDGMYFLGIEKRHDMEEATDVDAECWLYMGKVEARETKKFLGIDNPTPAQALHILRHTSWAMSHPKKSFVEGDENNAQFVVDSCRTQLIRLSKGLEAHPCRRVREGYLKAFAKECNPDLDVECLSCPPDVVPDQESDMPWCKWRFVWADKKG